MRAVPGSGDSLDCRPEPFRELKTTRSQMRPSSCADSSLAGPSARHRAPVLVLIAALAVVAAGCVGRPDYDTALAEAKTVFEAGDQARAFELFDELRRRFPDEREPYSYLAWAALELGQPERAVAAFEERIARGGEAVHVYHDILGSLLEEADRWDEAQEHYREAMRLDADYALTYWKLSRLLARSGDYPAALDLAREGVARFPTDLVLRSWLGDALRQRGRWEEAERELRQALALPGVGSYPHYSLGMVYFHTGRLEEARGELETSVELQPAAHPVWYQLAHVYELLGNEEGRARALEQFEVALRQRLKNWNAAGGAVVGEEP